MALVLMWLLPRRVMWLWRAVRRQRVWPWCVCGDACCYLCEAATRCVARESLTLRAPSPSVARAVALDRVRDMPGQTTGVLRSHHVLPSLACWCRELFGNTLAAWRVEAVPHLAIDLPPLLAVAVVTGKFSVLMLLGR